MLKWTLLWAVLKYRQRKCVKNCTICIKFLNMASGMRLFWNFRNCFNPINFLFKLYIYICCVFVHTLLSTQWFSWMLRWNLCGKSTTGCTQIFLYRPNVRNLLHLFAIVATTLKVLKLKPLLPCLKERKHVNTFSFHCFYSKDFIRWEKLSSD